MDRADTFELDSEGVGTLSGSLYVFSFSTLLGTANTDTEDYNHTHTQTSNLEVQEDVTLLTPGYKKQTNVMLTQSALLLQNLTINIVTTLGLRQFGFLSGRTNASLIGG